MITVITKCDNCPESFESGSVSPGLLAPDQSRAGWCNVTIHVAPDYERGALQQASIESLGVPLRSYADYRDSHRNLLFCPKCAPRVRVVVAE